MLRCAGACLLFLASISPSLAYQVKAYDAGIVKPSLQGNVVDFNKIKQTAYGSTAPTGGFVDHDVKFSGNGVVMKNGNNGSASSLGLYAEPFHDTTNYMAILGNGEERLQFDSYKTNFGLYWGSMDTFNYIEFSDKADEVAFFTGADLARLGLTPNGDQASDASNRYIEFSGLGRFDTVTLGSGGNSFEFDNVTASRVDDVRAVQADGAPAPLAGTGLLSLIAVGGIILSNRLRRSFLRS